MLKELVEFSRELEKNGIYDKIEETQQKIDKPIMVIPVKDDLSDIDTENIYFVVKDIEEETVNGKRDRYFVFDSFEKERRTELKNGFDLNCVKIHKFSSEGKDWQKILRNIAIYSKKPSNDKIGNKSIGTQGNNGTNSYNLLIFEGKFKSATLDNIKGTYKGDIFFRKEIFKGKMAETYNNKLISSKNIIPDDFDEKQKVSGLVNKITDNSNLDVIWGNICRFRESIGEYDQEKNEWKFPTQSMYFIIKFPQSIYSQNNIYRVWYEEYLSKRLFKTDPPNKDKGYPIGTCSVCIENKIETWIPNAFHAKADKKPFLMHVNRIDKHNIAVCNNCSILIYKFQELFLNNLKITLFPLFIDYKEREDSISLFKNEINLSKIGFKEIIRQVYQKTSRDVLDFYLIIYNAEVNIISFDYITGFRFKTKGMDIFKIEKYLNDNFFDLYIKAKKKYIGQLKDDYFSSLINTKNKLLDNILYRFRSQVFDYIYRANYNSLNANNIFEMYMTSLARKLKDFYDPENSESRVKKNITRMIESFYKLNNYFGGDFMETIDRIKQEKKVRDAESFAYYAGQSVYYLISQSESSAKTHAMVEPFINIRNLQVFRLKLEELFKAYKHKISLNNRCFNSIFSDIWAFLATNSQVQFSDNLKAYFYAGYFDTNENIFYEKKEDKGE